MIAVARVTPSSGSYSAAVLPLWVVGADTCPSLVVAAGPVAARRSPLCGDSAPGPVRGDRSSIEAPGTWCPGTGTAKPGSHYRGPARWPTGRGSSDPCGGRRTREGTARWTVPSTCLPAQTEPLDERAVAVDVGLGQVVQQPATPADQQEQAPPAVVVVLVLLEVLGEVADPAGQHRDLHLGRAGVPLDRGVVGHDLLLDSALERHGGPPGQVACGPRSGSRGQVSHMSGSPTTSEATSGADGGSAVITSGAGAPSGRGRCRQEPAGLGDVVRHRLDQFLDAGERGHGAQPG